MHPDERTVRELVSAQFPQWTDHAIRRMDGEGTVNALLRIGEHLVARLPLRPPDTESARRRLETEARGARELLGPHASCWGALGSPAPRPMCPLVVGLRSGMPGEALSSRW